MSSRLRSTLVLLAVLVLIGADPARAADPSPTPVPPLVEAEGDAAMGGPSVHAEMLEEHALEPMAFTEGDTPAALSTGAGRVTTDEAGVAMGGIDGLPNGLFREVFGYLPYWTLNSTSLANLDYSLVSTLAYFSIGAQSNGTLARFDSDGDPTSGWAGWTSSAMTGVINAAHARGVKVVPTVTMMAWNGNYTAMSTLLNSSANRSRLATEISAAVRLRTADGVNLDFEPVPASLRSQYTSFVREVKARLVADRAGSFVTVASMAGAATWSSGYDVAGLTASGAADALMVMAYDFHWSGSQRAGGVAPIRSPYILDVETALADHLELVPAAKLIWGVPYYGREWSTTSGGLNSLTNDVLESGASYYTFHRAEAAERGRKWDSVGRVPWYAFWDSTHDTWVQGYYDDVHSLTAKYDLVNVRGLRGVGIWHMLMDGTRRELWNTLDANFQGIWFEDIIGSRFRADILWIAEEGITGGCGFERFCPKNTVTREQMASFLARALDLPNATRDYFADDDASPHESDINRVAAAGITGGCGANRFCPRNGVTREQMASFLVRALKLPASTRDFFTDDNASAHESDINRLAQAGITGGCTTTTFCPRAVVVREQMAAFLHRALKS
ncbi:MAG: glycosyl hydrolase family 18 protein [Candidatus Limnocylindria bacterium]